MLKALISKELLEGIYGYKFLLALVLALTVIPFSLYAGAKTYKLQLREYTEANRESFEAFREQSPKAPHSAAHFGLSLTKPPTPLLAFSSGVQDILGNRTELDPHVAPRLSGGTAERTPLLSLFGRLDYAFAIQVIFGLFALVLSFDLVSGEREDGTLKLVVSAPVSRSRLILGKFFGGSLVLLLPLTAATLLGLLFFTPPMGIDLDGEQWLRILLIFLLSVLYVLMMFLIGLLVSVLARRRITSMIVLLIVWVGIIFVIPRLAASLAQQLQEIPSAEEVAGQLRDIRQAEAEKYQARNREMMSKISAGSSQSLPPAFQVESRRQMDEAVEEQAAKVLQAVDAAEGRQVSLATNLARLSPATAYLLAVTDLSGTGVYRHRHFLRHLDEFRKRFAGHFNDLESQGVESVEDFSSAPQFLYREETLGELAPRIITDVGLMLFVGVALFLAAFLAFLRTDLR